MLNISPHYLRLTSFVLLGDGFAWLLPVELDGCGRCLAVVTVNFLLKWILELLASLQLGFYGGSFSAGTK